VLSFAEYLSIAEEAARAAGRVLDEWGEKFTVREKSPSNLVTEADHASQQTIFRMIHERFPDHGFLGEEGAGETKGNSGYRWVVDPLDGTTNYVHRFPYYAVSIALEHEGELIVGAVYDPTRNEMFSAVRGAGATLNGRPIRPSQVELLGQAMLVGSLPVGGRADHPAVAKFLRLIPLAQTVQRTGSAALNLAYVACGRIDGFWSISLKPWDVAAGALLVAESGGRVTRTDGGPLSIETPDLLSTNGTRLHDELGELLA